MATLEDRFVGCLLGLALGDALGAPFEGGFVERLAWKALGLGRGDVLRWTDDTEMAVLLARSLVERGGVDPDALARRWAEGATWGRGYGAAARALLAEVRRGADWRVANRSSFPEGSFGNGAAMRVAPVGLWHHDDPVALERAAAASAEVTHAHPLGIEGAVLVALATGQALLGRVDVPRLVGAMRRAEFRDRLALALKPMEPEEVAERLGCSICAHESAITAVHLARRFDEFLPMVEFAVRVGGDVDTIAAMAGAIFGAQHGVGALPTDLLARLEDRAGIEQAARDLHAAWLRRGRAAPA